MQITMIHGLISLMLWLKLTMIPSNISTTWGYLIQQFENEKNNPEKTAELAKIAEDDVYTINKALEGLPEDLTLATHICRVNFK